MRVYESVTSRRTAALILTFDFDFALYDGLIRRRLRDADIFNQMVFCDLHSYQRELAALCSAPRCGTAYSVTPVYQQAAFHPKLYLLLGRDRGRLLVGSGNATVGGLLRNAEVFGRFEYDAAEQTGPHPAFKDSVRLIREIAQNASEVVGRQLRRAFAGAPWLAQESEGAERADKRELLVGGPGRVPLLDQMMSRLHGKTVRSVLVCSSSFDRQLLALQRLVTLTKSGNLQCILQPERANLDGEVVRRLGAQIDWRPFIDPLVSKKAHKNVRAHAKLMVFDCGDSEVAVYGSANASRPALLATEGNTEMVVMLPPTPRGTLVKLLNLEPSLQADSIADGLKKKKWVEEEEEIEPVTYPYILTAAVPIEGRIEVTLVNGHPRSGMYLEIAEGLDRPPLQRADLTVQGQKIFAALPSLSSTARVARMTDSKGNVLSNTVGFTWPQVASPQGALGVGARVEAAIVAMHEGRVLGTVLFELLDRFQDFEMVFTRPHRGLAQAGQKDSTLQRTAEEAPSTEAFYTDAVSQGGQGRPWEGDRVDLDLLASFVQPLTTTAKKGSEDIEEEADDAALAEEAERRAIDAKHGRATGEERQETTSLVARSTLERARRRLELRLRRAVLSIEQKLSNRKELSPVRPADVVRQIWMAHIGAFFAGRAIESAEHEPILCLEPRCFAEYMLRLCCGLAGGKEGGLLRHIPADLWTEADGDTLRRGLAFLWTSVLWAVHYVLEEWGDPTQDKEPADGIWDAVPELIAGRFVAAIQSSCQEPDTRDLARRFPASKTLPLSWFDTVHHPVKRLAEGIVRAEAHSLTSQSPLVDPGSCRPGTLVYNPGVGVTVFVGVTCGETDEPKYQLLDLARPGNAIRQFGTGARIVSVAVENSPSQLRWRAPTWLNRR